MFGRLIALVIAALLAVLVFFVWQNKEERVAAQSTQDAVTLSGLGVPVEVEACIAERLAVIDNYAETGIMNPADAQLSRDRARTECLQRN